MDLEKKNKHIDIYIFIYIYIKDLKVFFFPGGGGDEMVYMYIYACIFSIIRIIVDIQGYIVRTWLAMVELKTYGQFSTFEAIRCLGRRKRRKKRRPKKRKARDLQ